MIKRTLFFIAAICSGLSICAQDVESRLNKAVQQLLNDVQMKHAILGFYVVNGNTGKAVCNNNGGVGLAPASSQKVITSAAAMELLGESFRYSTLLGYNGSIDNNVLNGNLVLSGQGDPTFGSSRYPSNNAASVVKRITQALEKNGITDIEGNLVLDNSAFSYQPLPGGWIWDDIGNYYGAGSWALNWNENAYDLLLKPGSREGDAVTITGTRPDLQVARINSLLKTGKPGSGDNGYIYLPPYTMMGFAEGTIPPGGVFSISGALPNPAYQVGWEVQKALEQRKIKLAGQAEILTALDQPVAKQVYTTVLDTLYSPSLDSIVYWFLHKSINLYGEALLKTLALQQGKQGSTDNGLTVLRNFWKDNGIETSALKVQDGSGLSPQNRVTPEAMVQVLQYARTRPWFNSYYKAFPLYNDMKMKSGTIGGSKAFTGYHTAKDGTPYTFAIIINGYDGSPSTLVQKMYRVLNELR
ncbi:D-alanyl-D-alanine carboxypeptidase/D-alanyl-D-alanine endopeptidase [Filimonas effusa]|uniref:D-alanyl-D-alanine carboxypeptidase/D-alanyl-D-alanine-endopeptidase n=1 Tax=Filimonas effusa TaxID=2508721 RepID=A0A4Q1DCF3_9BACT|nr:D-alanyl-D-alanine carboxypeptidase/D-alanyl-D-alanine-endopeptidase [Filimonas effusa]RXK87194.1 D-alanyl-D-alanine carboxypeptidase/D-alanyl-D-alanine-endopeptidase [Filimonas effusa]